MGGSSAMGSAWKEDARAKLLERKPAARRRESEAEFETLACGSGSYLFRKT